MQYYINHFLIVLIASLQQIIFYLQIKASRYVQESFATEFGTGTKMLIVLLLCLLFMGFINLINWKSPSKKAFKIILFIQVLITLSALYYLPSLGILQTIKSICMPSIGFLSFLSYYCVHKTTDINDLFISSVYFVVLLISSLLFMYAYKLAYSTTSTIVIGEAYFMLTLIPIILLSPIKIIRYIV